jgi:hypothetical protein
VRLLAFESQADMVERVKAYNKLIDSAEAPATDESAEEDEWVDVRPDRYDPSLGGSLTSEASTRRLKEASERKKVSIAKKAAASAKKKAADGVEAPLRAALKLATNSEGAHLWPEEKRSRRPTVDILRAFLVAKGHDVPTYGLKRCDLVTRGLALCP